MENVTINTLSAALPDQLTIQKVIYPWTYYPKDQNGNPVEFGSSSYFDAITTNGGVLTGTFDGFCIDTDRLIDWQTSLTDSFTSYSAKVYSSYDVPK
jgi:hypothetical protein